MNNRKYRPRLSEIEIRMIITDMLSATYKYDSKNQDSHTEIINRLKYLIRTPKGEEKW